MTKKILLFCIAVLAAFLRFYHVASNPPSLTWDEVAWGYNAYSLGIDGRDEFGRYLPYNYLESFGDFKPPVYAYLDVIPVKIFGLNEFAVRFPSALFGTLTVLVTYFLVIGLFEKSTFVIPTKRQRAEESDTTKLENKVKSDLKTNGYEIPPLSVSWRIGRDDKYNYSQFLALLSAFILAISPWHILLSRAAFEANVATFFVVSGVTCFLSAMRKNRWLLVLSALCFVLSMYTFNSARIVSPLLVVVLSVIFLKRLWQMKTIAIIAAVVGLLLLAPTVPFLLSPQARLRYQEVNIFSDLSVIKTSNQEIDNDHNKVWSKLLHNRRLLFAGDFMQHYLDNLSPSFLFIKGDGNPKFSVQDVGQLYLWELPFFILGILFLFRRRHGWWFIVPIWLVLGIIPAAVALETPHALRIEGSLPMFQILSAIGLLEVFLFISTYKKESIKYKALGSKYSVIKNFVYAVFIIFAALNFIYFIHTYFVHYPQEFSAEWQYGYTDAISYVKQVQGNYDHVVMTTQLGRPYIYYLFYFQIPPSIFRNTSVVTRDAYGFVTVQQVGKYIFNDNTHIAGLQGRTIYIVVASQQVPGNAKLLKTFYLLDGGPVFKAYEI